MIEPTTLLIMSGALPLSCLCPCPELKLHAITNECICKWEPGHGKDWQALHCVQANKCCRFCQVPKLSLLRMLDSLLFRGLGGGGGVPKVILWGFGSVIMYSLLSWRLWSSFWDLGLSLCIRCWVGGCGHLSGIWVCHYVFTIRLAAGVWKVCGMVFCHRWLSQHSVSSSCEYKTDWKLALLVLHWPFWQAS